MQSRSGPRWRMLAWLVVAIGGLCVLAWLAMPARPPQQAPRALASRIGADRAPVLAAAAGAGPETETPAARRARLAAQMQLAEHTLCSYQQASRYPDGSRPISQHPDQIYPNAPVSENRPMRRKDGSIVPLTLHGLLLRDLAPAFPLTLRDVDGYLLTDGDPYRALMPRIDGKALVSRRYLPDQFSDAEWESEQRSRYLAEYERDVERARAELALLDPEAARPTDCADQKPPG